jgi:hypothetical protein
MHSSGDPRAVLRDQVMAASKGEPTSLYIATGYVPMAGNPRQTWVAVSPRDGWSRRYEIGPDAGPTVWAGKLTPDDCAPVARALLEAGFPDFVLPPAPPGGPSVILYVRGKEKDVVVQAQLPVYALASAPKIVNVLEGIFAVAKKSAHESEWLKSYIELARSPAGATPKPMAERVWDAVLAVADGSDVDGFTVMLDLPPLSTEIVQGKHLHEGLIGAPRTKIAIALTPRVRVIAGHLRTLDVLRVDAPRPSGNEPSLKLTVRCDKELSFERSFALSALDTIPKLRSLVLGIGCAAELAHADARQKARENPPPSLARSRTAARVRGLAQGAPRRVVIRKKQGTSTREVRSWGYTHKNEGGAIENGRCHPKTVARIAKLLVDAGFPSLPTPPAGMPTGVTLEVEGAEGMDPLRFELPVQCPAPLRAIFDAIDAATTKEGTA